MSSEETYRSHETDSANWLEVAQELRMSAALSWNALRAIKDSPPSEVRMERLAYVHSFMMLTAFAFENICRAIATLVKPGGWRYCAKFDGGHELAKLVPQFVDINDRERELLERLQVHGKWAGRYLIPKKPEQYVSAAESGARRWKPIDIETADGLFTRLEEKRTATWEQQQQP